MLKTTIRLLTFITWLIVPQVGLCMDIQRWQDNPGRAHQTNFFELQSLALVGNKTALLALASFKKKLANDHFKINYPKTRRLLVRLQLLTPAGRLTPEVRGAIRHSAFLRLPPPHQDPMA